MLNKKYKLDTKVTLKNGRVGLVWANPEIEDKIVYVITLNSGEQISVNEDEILKGEDTDSREFDEEIIQNISDLPDVTEPLEDDDFIFPVMDDEIDPLVDDDEYDEEDFDNDEEDFDDEEYDDDDDEYEVDEDDDDNDDIKFQNKPNTSQYIPLKHFIHENTAYLVVAYALNYNHNMAIHINEMDTRKSRFDDARYGNTIHYIEPDSLCDVIEGQEVDTNTNEVLIMRTYHSWYSVPIEVMAYAMDVANSILLNENTNKTEWLTTNIKRLKDLRTEIQNIKHILKQVDKQIIECETELKKIAKVN